MASIDLRYLTTSAVAPLQIWELQNEIAQLKADVLQITTTTPDAGAYITVDIPNAAPTNCPNCGAPLRGKKKRCEYCATEF